VRLFFALWPPPETAQALAAWAAQVRRASGGRAVATPNIHLTLAFLGDADPAKATAAARRTTGTGFCLPLSLAKYWKHNHIVWIGPADMPPALGRLTERLQLELFRDGFILERRPFAAHITLIRKASPPGPLPAVPAVSWPVSEFVLVRSDRDNSGSTYAVVDRFPLAGKALDEAK
jgi:RNA 2',3'-cyclic 3'-phosphodiesterase